MSTIELAQAAALALKKEFAIGISHRCLEGGGDWEDASVDDIAKVIEPFFTTNTQV